VCSIEEIQSWLLFPDVKASNAWVQAQAGAPPAKKEGGFKTAAKKPGAKQSGTRKPSPANKKDR
jgi:hypothetical protein